VEDDVLEVETAEREETEEEEASGDEDDVELTEEEDDCVKDPYEEVGKEKENCANGLTM
jgi:hypothetical protein